jgi:hypothetical protein
MGLDFRKFKLYIIFIDFNPLLHSTTLQIIRRIICVGLNHKKIKLFIFYGAGNKCFTFVIITTNAPEVFFFEKNKGEALVYIFIEQSFNIIKGGCIILIRASIIGL